MASLRRNTATATDGVTTKFLYAILKQLDLKSIDWNEVAGHLGISNGHAARMRYSRFKQQMEGTQPSPRKPRRAVAHAKPVKEKPKPKLRPGTKSDESWESETLEKIEGEPKQPILGPYEQTSFEQSIQIKREPEQPILGLYEKASAEQSMRIKNEPLEENAGGMEWKSSEPHNDPEEDFIDPKLEDDELNSMGGLQVIKEEPRVKNEPVLD